MARRKQFKTVLLYHGRISVRKKANRKGTQTLYLDIRRKGGGRDYDFDTLNGLVLTGIPHEDKATEELVRTIVSELSRQISASRNGVQYHSSVKLSADFITYFEGIADKRKQNAWSNTLVHLRKFSDNQPVQFRHIDTRWLESFKEYLLGNVADSSAQTYFSKIRAALKVAVKEGILVQSPADNVPTIKCKDKARAFLSEEELRKLYRTPCSSDAVKRAFLFACYTGLRLSDITALQWESVRLGAVDAVDVVQQKTGRLVSMFLHKDAIEMLGEPKKSGKVFELLSETHTLRAIKRWVASAGIGKSVSFHTSRHTFATRLQAGSGDIYLTAKAIGHTSTQHTQRYARMTDERLRASVLKLPSVKDEVPAESEG